MISRVKVPGAPDFPKLYLAQTSAEFQQLKEAGLPVVKWRKSYDEFLYNLFLPVVKNMFQGLVIKGKAVKFESLIYWVPESADDSEKHTGFYDANEMIKAQLEYDQYVDDLDHDLLNPDIDGKYHRFVDVAEGPRECIADNSDTGYYTAEPDAMSIEDYLGDLASYVNIDVLMNLGLLPKFASDIADTIRHNLSQSMRWTEGYTKKLGYPLGKTNRKTELPNLVIIDVSHSIPDGIATTMLMLADTLREQCNADLIITSARSGYYPAGSELPSVQTLRDYFKRSNESAEFMAILDQYIAGREWGHVISFGDDDWPGSIDGTRDWQTHKTVSAKMDGTKVHEVHHFHTWDCEKPTGYARWVDECCIPDAVHHDTSWCKMVNKNFRF